ncbi:LysR family transcriptional regulator [Amycolatopsis sp. NEAU-NG30]|uniref:LysR family transcriptional regulator n=1 Tax=Amycolatopsis melonis TaxID=3156488 RepID=A0ABV0LSU6_9PSEU
MELRALRYFVTVADELHFGRAADRLHIAQPAVSRQIARLERELGVRLFDRSPQRVRLTAAGHRLLDAAREALAAADRVRVVAREQAGVMRIGMGAGQFTARLERGIDALRERAPAFDVALVDLPLPARLNALRQGEIDLALTRGVRSAPGVRVLPAWTESLFAVVSTRHPAAGGEIVGVAELAADPFRTSQDHDQAVLTALREAGVQVRPDHRTGTIQDTIIEVGSDPRTWTALPTDQAAEIRSTRVRAIPLAPHTPIIGSIAVPDDLPPTCMAAHRAAFGD